MIPSKKKIIMVGEREFVDHYPPLMLLVSESINMPINFPGGKCWNASSLQSGHVFFIGNHCPYMQCS